MKARIPDFRFVYADAEFDPDNQTPSGLVSLALHSDIGDLYVVNKETDREGFCSNDFRRDHIWSKLPLASDGSLDFMASNVMSYNEIRSRVTGYFHDATGGRKYRRSVGFIADHATQDMQRIHDLFGGDWDAMPISIPRRPFQDIATLEDIAGVVDDRLPNGLRLPEKHSDQAHNALYDARWDAEVHRFLMDHSRAVRVACGIELLED